MDSRWRYSTVAASILAAGVGLTSTLELGLGPSWWDEQRIVLLTVLLLLSAGGIATRPGQHLHGVTTLMLIVSFAIGILSSFESARPFVALVDVATYAMLLCFALQFAGAPLHALAASGAVFVLAIATPYSTGVIARYVSALLLSMPVGADTFLVGFANPRFPAHIEALTIPFLPLALVFARSLLSRAAVSTVGALWWMCVIGSGSRTAWVALAVAGIVAFFCQGYGTWIREQLRLFVLGIGLYVAGFLVIPFLLDLSSTVETGRLSDYASFGTRIHLWELSLQAIAHDPLLGLGPMHFAFGSNGIAAHPHNFWLQTASEWGLVVGTMLVFASLTTWRRVVCAARALPDRDDARTVEKEGAAATGIATAFTAWLVAIQLDGVMVVPTSQAASAIVLGLAYGLATTDGAAAMRSRFGRVAAFALFVAAALVICALPFTSFGQVQVRESDWRAAHPATLLLPRFWQQGWIGPDDDPTARGELVRR